MIQAVLVAVAVTALGAGFLGWLLARGRAARLEADRLGREAAARIHADRIRREANDRAERRKAAVDSADGASGRFSAACDIMRDGG